MNNLNLKQFETFVTVAEKGSFTKAANALYMAQSTVSNHIQQLEESLGLILFVRDMKRNISLTPDGNRIYQFAKEILLRCSELEETILENKKSQLIIGASTVPTESILPELIHKFIKTHPNCRFVVKNGDSDQIQRMLTDGEISIGFVGTSDNRQEIIYEKITEDRFVMITPNTPGYVKLHEQGVYGKELLNKPLIFRENGSGTQKLIDNYLGSMDVTEDNLNIVAYVSSSQLQKDLVKMGTGVAILSEYSTRDLVSSGRVLRFEMERNCLSRNIYMAKDKKGILNSLALEFDKFVKSNFKLNFISNF